VVFLGIYAIVVIYLYGRQRRWYATGGWILIAGGIIALTAGLGSRFAWGGLVFLFITALGCLMVIMDIFGRLRRRR